MIIKASSFTAFKTRAAAEAMAAENQADDADFSYRVEEVAIGFVVVVYDEDGFRLGPI